jgi:hypothetical protein
MLNPWRRIEKLEDGLEELRDDIRAIPTAPPQPFDAAPVWGEFEAIRERLEEMRHAIAEGIERVDRSERRIQQVVRRAQKKLAEAGYQDAGVEAEADQLQFLNGNGSRREELQHMPANVAPRLDVTGVPGTWSEDDITELSRKLTGG